MLTTLGARFAPKDPDIPHEETDGEPRESHVIIAGFGPFGRIVARVLATLEIPFTAIELDPGRVRLVRQFGSKIYYGDASRFQVLLSARADRAAAIVIAVEDVETSLKIANQVRRSFPNVKIMARAADPFPRDQAARSRRGLRDPRNAALKSCSLGKTPWASGNEPGRSREDNSGSSASTIPRLLKAGRPFTRTKPSFAEACPMRLRTPKIC